jgi:hypothetical protein
LDKPKPLVNKVFVKKTKDPDIRKPLRNDINVIGLLTKFGYRVAEKRIKQIFIK